MYKLKHAKNWFNLGWYFNLVPCSTKCVKFFEETTKLKILSVITLPLQHVIRRMYVSPKLIINFVYYFIQGSHIKIKTTTEIPVQVDGEPWLQPAGDIVVLKSALKVCQFLSALC